MNRTQLVAALAERAKESRSQSFSAAALCFGPQLAFAASNHRRKVLRGGRRSGKTRGIGVRLLQAVRRPPFTNVFYLTLTLKNAKRQIWPEVKRLNEEYHLGGVPNESEGFLRFPQLGGDVNLYLGGVKDAGEVDKVRGIPAKEYVLDEAQSLPQRVVKPLLKDVIQPALMDYQGCLTVAGTPGALCAGYFYDIDMGALASGWEHHGWTVRENERLPALLAGVSIEDILADILRENHWTVDNPTFRREYLGEWVQDEDALVFKYDRTRNGYTELPTDGGAWTYVIGVDLGFEDADAIAVLGWQAHDPTIYLVYEDVVPKQGITPLAEKLGGIYRQYKPIKLVADFGGLGKKIAEEIRRRFSLPIEAADKARKLEHIELLNDALRGGRLKARANSQFAEDCAIVQWDQDQRAKGIQKVADDYHSDITDAVLYAFRACQGWLSRPAVKTPEPGREAVLARLMAEQQRMEAADPLEAYLDSLR